MTKRLKIFMGIVTILMCFILATMYYRIFYFNKGGLDVLSTQYNKTISTFYPRGNIYDRNGILLNNRTSYGSELYYPKNNNDKVFKYLIGDIQTNEDSTTSNACHGISGIEKAYDFYLNGGEAIKVCAKVDAVGDVIEGEYYILNDHINKGSNVNLTIDYKLQSLFEKEMKQIAKERNYKAISAVITSVESGEILAMCSYGGYMNNCVLSYQPGSIMKIVSSAVAIDNGLVSEEMLYNCTGEVPVDDTTRHCSGLAVHGEENIVSAFANSCNCYYYELTKSLNYLDEDGIKRNMMLDKAMEWGYSPLGEKPDDKFILDYDEHYSFVPRTVYNEMSTFNIALGQGDIQASPYLINCITTAIAGGGSINKPYIVKNVTDMNGKVLLNEEVEEYNLNLKPSTISLLQKMMRETCLSGTGIYHNLSEKGGLAGKTGTSESIEGKNYHSWFTGYFPSETPKYAMTVFIEEGGNAPYNALYVYDRLANTALDLYGD